MKSHVTQCHRFSIPPISLTFAGKTKASGKCQQTQAEKSWAGKEKKNGKCSQVDSPSEYFVSLSHFACVFSNPTVNMPSVGKGRWWRRKRDGDTHVSFSKFSPHVAVNHFGPKKNGKSDRRSETETTANYKFCIGDEKCQDHAPSGLRPPATRRERPFSRLRRLYYGNSSLRERRTEGELRCTRHFNKIKRGKNAENVLQKRRKGRGEPSSLPI